MDSKKSDNPKQANIEKDGVHLQKSNFEAKQPNSRVNNPKSKYSGSDSQQEVAKKREAIKRQLYIDTHSSTYKNHVAIKDCRPWWLFFL